MRKIVSLTLVLLMMLSMLVLTACSSEKATVESVFELNSEYAGRRTIKIKYPLDTHIDSLAKEFEIRNPLAESEKSSFEYKGVESDGYTFVIDIVFDSREDYLSQMSELVGRDVVSDMYQPDSVMCSGTRMKEDFDVSDIMRWMIDLSENNDETDSVEYDYAVNTVSINGTIFNTSSTVDISQREGKAVDSIVVETANLKNDTFDRTVTFYIPDKTYSQLKGSIEPYFDSITPDVAQYSDWTNQGENWEYKVIMKSLSIEELSEYTAMLLDTDKDVLFYGDRDNTSTPLTEGLVFEESFNTFSFMNGKGKSTPISYRYSLPVKTTHGDGSVFTGSKWSNLGEWNDGVYSVSSEDDVFEIRIPDGIQYSINGIRNELSIAGENNFVRTTEFLYSKEKGMDGMLYARDFFESKGATVEIDEDDENLICRVICQGDTATITNQLVKYFGSGNFMAYTIKDKAMSQKTEVTDYVNLSYMLNQKNAERPITYTVSSDCAEKLISLECDTGETQKASSDAKELTVDIVGGQSKIVYKGSIPEIGSIISFCVILICILIICVAVAVLILRERFTGKSIFTKRSKAEVSEEPKDRELTDKEVMDEINAEIEKQIGELGDDGEISELERIVNSDDSFLDE